MFSDKSRLTALILAIFLGFFGAQRYYVRRTGTGVIYTLTLGLCGIGWILDIVLICLGRFKDRYGKKLTYWTEY